MKENFIKNYLSNTIEEFHKITWPTKDSAIKLTMIVLIVCVIAMIVNGVVDSIFQQLFSYLILK
ncbi:MAG: hypothetical protein UR28_C0028G0011 [Candidatus Peregrinibacteria bacterium GW2011_GWF2_33_10]|nr:MAG: hypothetical protein UR28_C0028G0011 [Candidatus Peregrinibacteria bacterium GW2011_GWF2_33_10]OGJ44404.1 MAG: preprotein translocase subunit SecE [Candidatus Peregrinibacteria bacterium RIFOXYA12_FULL_33_12]OGJ45861.1 MAG: preprotein translocase subunit SecE [Candidatus Peregrinibacteria bacterium RIFOXYA2_FULL_33_21]OGJ51347.1 MAG: preprotein translocase subunit SecE [Candidatus Peregrinibacteria bacterium RIFOXYB2_FULL_33_20]